MYFIHKCIKAQRSSVSWQLSPPNTNRQRIATHNSYYPRAEGAKVQGWEENTFLSHGVIMENHQAVKHLFIGILLWLFLRNAGYTCKVATYDFILVSQIVSYALQ